MIFQVGEETSDRFTVNFDNSTRSAAGEGSTNIDDILKNGVEVASTTYNGSELAADERLSFSYAVEVGGNMDGFTGVTIDGLTEGDDFTFDSSTGTVTIIGDGLNTTADAYTITWSGTDDGVAMSDETSDITLTANGTENTVLSSWSELDQTASNHGISVLDTAIKSLAKTIQQVGDDQARLSSKEESLSLGISNTEATRSRIEDADFAKEQMSMMKLQILQQTSVSAFTQSNSAPQVVLSLFR
jgi:flagellin